MSENSTNEAVSAQSAARTDAQWREMLSPTSCLIQ